MSEIECIRSSLGDRIKHGARRNEILARIVSSNPSVNFDQLRRDSKTDLTPVHKEQVRLQVDSKDASVMFKAKTLSMLCSAIDNGIIS